jgi:hypothetical protein
MKSPTAVAGFEDDVMIPPIAHDKDLDYEGELVSKNELRLGSPGTIRNETH